jgi:EAL domain-containing protein (putative c-di-GMP-specific phosphodiesterase class I)
MTTALDLILAPGGLRVLFQPILRVRGGSLSLHALECLVRGPKGTNMESPLVLFEYVRRKGEESLVDRACVCAALRASAFLPPDVALTLNVHASTLARDPEFLNALADTATEQGIALSRLTVEIVEHAPLWDGPLFREALDALRHTGVRVALDDVGLGHSNFKMIIESTPDYFKIDAQLVRGVSSDYRRRVVVDSVRRLAGEFGGQAIAEGVEVQADLDTLTALGLELIQGHLFFPALGREELSEVLARLPTAHETQARPAAGDPERVPEPPAELQAPPRGIP